MAICILSNCKVQDHTWSTWTWPVFDIHVHISDWSVKSKQIKSAVGVTCTPLKRKEAGYSVNRHNLILIRKTIGSFPLRRPLWNYKRPFLSCFPCASLRKSMIHLALTAKAFGGLKASRREAERENGWPCLHFDSSYLTCYLFHRIALFTMFKPLSIVHLMVHCSPWRFQPQLRCIFQKGSPMFDFSS